MYAIKLHIVIMVINNPRSGPYLLILASEAFSILFAANEYIVWEKSYGIIVIINNDDSLILICVIIDNDSIWMILASEALHYYLQRINQKYLMIYHILLCINYYE